MKQKEQEEVYPFSRFNRKIEIVKYTDEEYNKIVAPLSTDWSKEETDHLFKLCERFGLRFIIISDRYDSYTDSEDTKPNADQKKVKKRDAKAKDKENKKNKKMDGLQGKYSERTVDEIKERYYSVAKAVLEHKG